MACGTFWFKLSNSHKEQLYLSTEKGQQIFQLYPAVLQNSLTHMLQSAGTCQMLSSPKLKRAASANTSCRCALLTAAIVHTPCHCLKSFAVSAVLDHYPLQMEHFWWTRHTSMLSMACCVGHSSVNRHLSNLTSHYIDFWQNDKDGESAFIDARCESAWPLSLETKKL